MTDLNKDYPEIPPYPPRRSPNAWKIERARQRKARQRDDVDIGDLLLVLIAAVVFAVIIIVADDAEHAEAVSAKMVQEHQPPQEERK